MHLCFSISSFSLSISIFNSPTCLYVIKVKNNYTKWISFSTSYQHLCVYILYIILRDNAMCVYYYNIKICNYALTTCLHCNFITII